MRSLSLLDHLTLTTSVLDDLAPVTTPAPQPYTYRRRFRDYRAYPEFRQIAKNFHTFEVGEVRILPRTSYRISDADAAHFRWHFRKYAVELGYFPGYHYGIQRDTQANCMKLIKLHDGRGLPDDLV